MQELIKEAFNSYQAYLAISGVLDVHEAKLSLMKWPDIAYTAVKMAEDPDDPSLRIMLKHDVAQAIYEPIRQIHDATMRRVKDLSGNWPAKAEETAKKAKSIWPREPVEAKKMLTESIGNLFTTLNTMTNVEYPEIKNGSDN